MNLFTLTSWEQYRDARNRYAREWAEGHDMTPTPGLHRVERNIPREYGIATKVTGRNLAAVSYIVALEAENTETELTLIAGFGIDGSLLGMTVRDAEHGDDTYLNVGEYLVLGPGDEQAHVMPADVYNRWYRPVD